MPTFVDQGGHHFNLDLVVEAAESGDDLQVWFIAQGKPVTLTGDAAVRARKLIGMKARTPKLQHLHKTTSVEDLARDPLKRR